MESLIAPAKKAERAGRAPAHLSAEAKAFYDRVVAEFVLEPHHLKTLQVAAESWDRLQQARRALAKEGAVYTDRFGAPRKSPWVSIDAPRQESNLRHTV